MDTRVMLRPLKRNAWSGLAKYRHCYEDLRPYWTRSGRIYTGLTIQDEEKFTKLLGIDLSVGSEFWANFFIRTWGKDLYLNLEDPMDELRYTFLKNHKEVKRSLLEHKASANFALINKDEEAKRSNIMGKIKRTAAREFDRLTPDDMRACLRLYGHNGDTLSNELVQDKLWSIVEGSPQSFIDRWSNNKNRELEAIIERAISMNVIRRNKNIYKYGTDIIGHSLLDTVGYLEDPKNQDVKIAILKQVESKSFIRQEVKEDVVTVDEDIETAIKMSNRPNVELPEVEKKTFVQVDEELNKTVKVDTILAKEVVKSVTKTKKSKGVQGNTI